MIIDEAKEHLADPRVGRKATIDWARLEGAVMTAVENERPTLVREVERARLSRSRDIAMRATACALAIAASVAVFMKQDHDAPLGESTSSHRLPASSLRTSEGAGEVRIDGIVATPGYVLHVGDSINVEGSRAVLERARKVTWLLEQDVSGDPVPAAHARVKSAGEPLVLDLEHGVIEAQVAPVSVGEAFAVDVSTHSGVVRVAVHGTHLRVARAGDRVIVDLTEGVVSIGVPPRTGITVGTLVTAPAHVELDATDLSTLHVDHAPSSVRAAVSLSPHDLGAVARPPEIALPLESLPAAPPAPPVVAAARESRSLHAETDTEATALTKPEPSPKGLPPRDAITAGIRECAASVKNRSGDVHVTVTSNLRLRVAPGGVVESAQFSPPLVPDIQTCAAQIIYKTRLEETGLVTIPIEFSY
jgi:hypothetical protein